MHLMTYASASMCSGCAVCSFWYCVLSTPDSCMSSSCACRVEWQLSLNTLLEILMLRAFTIAATTRTAMSIQVWAAGKRNGRLSVSRAWQVCKPGWAQAGGSRLTSRDQLLGSHPSCIAPSAGCCHPGHHHKPTVLPCQPASSTLCALVSAIADLAQQLCCHSNQRPTQLLLHIGTN